MPATPTAKKRRGRLFRAFEHFVLGLGMSVIASIVERRILKALKQGAVRPAPRRAAGQAESLEVEGLPTEVPREAQLSTASHEVGQQPDG